jgi:hypothetical protein
LMNYNDLLLAGAVKGKHPEDRPAVVRIMVSYSVSESTDGLGYGSRWWAE